LWYWYEVEERIRYWRRKLPSISFVDFKTEQLNDYDSVVRLLNDLKIDFSNKEINEIVNVHENLKTHEKKNLAISEVEADSMHQSFQDLLSGKGYTI